jgi:hypothetical protein
MEIVATQYELQNDKLAVRGLLLNTFYPSRCPLCLEHVLDVMTLQDSATLLIGLSKPENVSQSGFPQ